jgi:hypothetical protein
MKNVFKNIIALIILGVAIFVFRQSILSGYFLLQDKYFPCSRSISYSIGTVDPSFGISNENFLSDIKEAENAWEASVNKDLFTYLPQGGEISINLIYDNRQATTQQLKSINTTLANDKNSYNDLKNQFDALKADYQNKKATLETQIIALRDKNGRYTESDIALLNNLEANLNVEADQINTLVGELNKSANTFNNQATQYNTVNNSLGDEFEEGLYSSDQSGKKIDIYQFENKNKLERVLMHEMGHALSLDHVNNPNAIMYKTNNGTSLALTIDDINELKTHCGIK